MSTKAKATPQSSTPSAAARIKRRSKLVQVPKGKRGIGRANECEWDETIDDHNDAEVQQQEPKIKRKRAKATTTKMNSSAAGGNPNSGHVPEYRFMDIDQLLDDEDQDFSALAENAAGTALASMYPPLPTMDDDDYSEHNDDSTIASANNNFQSNNTRNVPAVAQPLRHVPHVPNAAQLVQEGSSTYETEIRTVEGHFRAGLHHLLMVQTGRNSFRTRQRLPEKEDEYFDKVKKELDEQLPGVDSNWYAQDSPFKPFCDRLQHLLFSALLTQSGRGAGYVDPNQFTDECYLEARKWTLEKLKELTDMAMEELDDNEHLRTTRQTHLMLPNK